MRHMIAGVALFGLALWAAIAASGAAAQGAAQVSIAVDLDPRSAAGIRIEGLVADASGRLYTADLDSRRLFRYTPSSNTLETLGTLPRSASGMAFDSAGNLYMASGDVVLRVPATVLAGTGITATDVVTFATGVPGANGLAFDSSGRLYVSGGATGNIYVVATDGVTRTFASGLTSERQEQRISTNGLAFWTDGTLYSANTGTGSIDRITFNPDGTFKEVRQWVKDSKLLGADGITFASNGDLYVAANERNAIVRVTPQGQVSDVAVNGNSGPLEFPASPAFSGNALYASNFDIERGANAPNAGGIGASIAKIDVGVTGLPLPVVASQAQPTAQATAQATAQTTTSPAATGTAAVSTPQPTATSLLPQPTATTEVLPTMPAMPEATATVIAPGMPTTGQGASEGWPAAMGLALALVALAAGFRLKQRRARG